MSQREFKLKPWTIIAIAVIATVIVVAAFSSLWWMNQANQAQYTTVKIFSDNVAHATLGDYTYTFLYKWSLHTLDPQNPIEIQVSGLSKTLPAKLGTYNVLSIEVIVSEVHDDYVILKVRQP